MNGYIPSWAIDYSVGFGALLTSAFIIALQAIQSTATPNFGILPIVLTVVGSIFLVVGTLERFVMKYLFMHGQQTTPTGKEGVNG